MVTESWPWQRGVWVLVGAVWLIGVAAGCADEAHVAPDEQSDAEPLPGLEERTPHGGVDECLFGVHCAEGGRCFQGFCVQGEALSWSDLRAEVDVRPLGRWLASDGRILLEEHEPGVLLEVEVVADAPGPVPLLLLRSDEPQVPRQPRELRVAEPGPVSWWIPLERGADVAVRVLAPGGVLSVEVARAAGPRWWEGELAVRTFAGRELLLPWRHFGELGADQLVSWAVEEPWFLRGAWTLVPDADGWHLQAPGDAPAEGRMRRGPDGLWQLHVQLPLHNGAETLTGAARLDLATRQAAPPSQDPDAVRWPWTPPTSPVRPDLCPTSLRPPGAADIWEELAFALEAAAAEDLRCDEGVCGWRALVCALDRLPDAHADGWPQDARSILARSLVEATRTLEAVQEAEALHELLLRVGGFGEGDPVLSPAHGLGAPPWWSDAVASTYWRILLGAWERAAHADALVSAGAPTTEAWRVWDEVAAEVRPDDPGALAVLLVALRALDDAWRRGVQDTPLPRVWRLSERLRSEPPGRTVTRPGLDTEGVRRLAVDQRLEPLQGSWWQDEVQRASLALASHRQEVERLRHHLVQEVVGESERRERQQLEVLRHGEEWEALCGAFVATAEEARAMLPDCGRDQGSMHRAWLGLLGALEAERRVAVEQGLHALRVEEKSRLLEAQREHHDAVLQLRTDGVEQSLEALLHEDRLRRQAGRRASEGYPFWDALSWGAQTGTALFGQAAALSSGSSSGGGGGAAAAAVGEAIDFLAATLQRRARRQREAEVRALQEQADRVQRERVRAERMLEVTIYGMDQEERLRESAARLRLLLAESDRLAVQVEEARLQGLRAWHELQAHHEEAERVVRRWEVMESWSLASDAVSAWRARLGLQAVELRRVERSGVRAQRAMLRSIETVEAHLGARLPALRERVETHEGAGERLDSLEASFAQLEDIALHCGRPGEHGELRISVRRDLAGPYAERLDWPLDPGSQPPAAALRMLTSLGVPWRTGWAFPLFFPVEVSGLLAHGCAALIETVQVEVTGHTGPAPVVLIAHEGRGQLRSCADGALSPVVAPPAVAVLEAGRAVPGTPSMALAGRPMIGGWTLLIPQDVAPNDALDLSNIQDWWITIGFRYRSPSGLPGCPLESTWSP